MCVCVCVSVTKQLFNNFQPRHLMGHYLFVFASAKRKERKTTISYWAAQKTLEQCQQMFGLSSGGDILCVIFYILA